MPYSRILLLSLVILSFAYLSYITQYKIASVPGLHYSEAYFGSKAIEINQTGVTSNTKRWWRRLSTGLRETPERLDKEGNKLQQCLGSTERCRHREPPSDAVMMQKREQAAKMAQRVHGCMIGRSRSAASCRP